MSIGISAVATDALGDIVYVDLPEVGSTVTAGETCGESGVHEVRFGPVLARDGRSHEINDAVVDDPALINNDPYGAGWLFKVAAESEGPLLSAQEYAPRTAANCERRGSRDALRAGRLAVAGCGPVRTRP